MTPPTRIERLRNAIIEAATGLKRPADDAGPPSPGDLFVFDLGIDAAIEWLVVRSHLDDPDLLLLAPADEFPFAGMPDVQVPQDLVPRPLTIRCGETLWIPSRVCEPRLRIGVIPEEVLRLVRSKIADLARGRVSGNAKQRRTDADPEYETWLGLVEQSRERLQSRAGQDQKPGGEVIPFERLVKQPPIELAAEPQYSLAADAGDSLLADLDNAFIEATAAIRYHEIPISNKGKLLLLADDEGVCAIWSGSTETRPELRGRAHGGERLATWNPGPKGMLHRAQPLFPWIEGQVVLSFGTDPCETVIIQR